MRIGVLGSGDVGQTLASGFIGLGQQVKLGTRDPGQDKVRAWVAQNGAKASAGTFAETAAFGELLVLAVLGTAVDEVIRLADPANFAGKVVIDPTNALDASHGFPPTLFIGGTDSLGECIQRTLPHSRVVKAFNIVGYSLMVHPTLPDGPPTMFICGNDADAKREVTEILTAFGWDTLETGGIEGSRYLEAMAMVWILTGALSKHWLQAFKMLRG